MHSRLIDNRAKLSRLIYDLGEFSAPELLQTFRSSQDGETALDGGQTIREYLEELAMIGVLQQAYERYSVVGSRPGDQLQKFNRGTPQRADRKRQRLYDTEDSDSGARR